MNFGLRMEIEDIAALADGIGLAASLVGWVDPDGLASALAAASAQAGQTPRAALLLRLLAELLRTPEADDADDADAAGAGVGR